VIVWHGPAYTTHVHGTVYMSLSLTALTSHRQEIPQDLFSQLIFLQHESTVHIIIDSVKHPVVA